MYLEVINGEKKNYESSGKPRLRNHIWLTVKRLKKQMRIGN